MSVDDQGSHCDLEIPPPPPRCQSTACLHVLQSFGPPPPPLDVKAQHVYMYYNLLDSLMLSLSPVVGVNFTRWICWGWMIVWSAGATCSISLISGLHWIPSILSDNISNSLAHRDNILCHLGIHPLADVRRPSSVQSLLVKAERVAWK